MTACLTLLGGGGGGPGGCRPILQGELGCGRAGSGGGGWMPMLSLTNQTSDVNLKSGGGQAQISVNLTFFRFKFILANHVRGGRDL